MEITYVKQKKITRSWYFNLRTSQDVWVIAADCRKFGKDSICHSSNMTARLCVLKDI